MNSAHLKEMVEQRDINVTLLNHCIFFRYGHGAQNTTSTISVRFLPFWNRSSPRHCRHKRIKIRENSDNRFAVMSSWTDTFKFDVLHFVQKTESGKTQSPRYNTLNLSPLKLFVG